MFDAPAISPRHAAAAACLTQRCVLVFANHPDFALGASVGRHVGEHRRYSPLDVVRLAVAARLTSAGLTVAEAAHVVRETVDAALFAVRQCKIELPAAVISLRLGDLVAHVVPCPGGMPRVTTRRCLTGSTTAEIALLVRVGDIAADALQRLG